ncbi:DsbA family protein [Vibrio fortis]|uniref:DsbA family protein n=1 Tax=Vibrio fortis TaxID=212667 RepID=UPI004068680C
MKKVNLSFIGFIAIVLGALAFFNANEPKPSSYKDFNPIEGTHYVKLETFDPDALQAFETLGMQPYQNTIISSYHCGACLEFSKHQDALNGAFVDGFKYQKLELPRNNSLVFEYDYSLKTASQNPLASNLQEELFKVAAGADKSSLFTMAKLIGVNLEEVVHNEELRLASETVADALLIEGTPTIVIGGKYKIIRSNHKSWAELIKTIHTVMKDGTETSEG